MRQGISDRRTFDRLRRSGIDVRAGELRLRHLPGDRSDAPVRTAFAIPRRFGTAVARNRMRRRIRGTLDELAATGRGLPPGDTLIIVAPDARDLGYGAIRDRLESLMDKLENARTSEP